MSENVGSLKIRSAENTAIKATSSWRYNLDSVWCNLI